MKTKIKYKAAWGKYYWTEKWVEVSYLKYLWLKLNGYAVRKEYYETEKNI